MRFTSALRFYAAALIFGAAPAEAQFTEKLIERDWIKERATAPREPDWIEGIVFLVSRTGVTEGSEIPIRTTAPAQGKSFATGKDGCLLIALSNHTSVYAGPMTRFTISRFEQVAPDPSLPVGREFEPSRSRLEIKLEAGEIALRRGRPNPTSEFTIVTPEGKVRGDSRVLLIDMKEDSKRVFADEGIAEIQRPGGDRWNLVPREHYGDLIESSPSFFSVKTFSFKTSSSLKQRFQRANYGLTISWFDFSNPEKITAEVKVPRVFFTEVPYYSHRFTF